METNNFWLLLKRITWIASRVRYRFSVLFLCYADIAKSKSNILW